MSINKYGKWYICVFLLSKQHASIVYALLTEFPYLNTQIPKASGPHCVHAVSQRLKIKEKKTRNETVSAQGQHSAVNKKDEERDTVGQNMFYVASLGNQPTLTPQQLTVWTPGKFKDS